MRTLHLIRGSCSPHPDDPSFTAFGAMAACASAIAADPAGAHRVVLLGDRRAERDAALAGLRVDRRVHPPLGLDALAWSLVRRERRFAPERVRTWSPGLGPIARLVSRGSVTETRWSAKAMPGDSGPPGADIPPLDGLAAADRLGPDDRDALRASLGAGPGDRVVALLADPPAHGDARRFAFILGLLEVGVGPVVGMMSAGSSQLTRGRRFHRLAVRRSPLLAVAGSVIPWLRAADVALLDGQDDVASRSAATRAVRLGIPLVGPCWLADVDSTQADSPLHTTDGRTRTLLPAMLKALGDSATPSAPGKS